MFATLASGYPRPRTAADTSGDDIVRAVIAELEAAGLEILSDGGVRRDDPLGGVAARLQGFEIGDPQPWLDGIRTYRRPRAIHEPRWDGAISLSDWQVASAATNLPVKQALVGPYTLGRMADPGPLTRERFTMAVADALAHEVRALIAASVPIIQIDEDAATEIGANPAEQQLFKAAHRRLTNAIGEAHLTLAITGGSIAAMPANVLFDAPYRSYLVDVVGHPENWALLTQAPTERGIIAGIADHRTDAADDRDHVEWAALYAAALGSRGPQRVGLAPSGSLAGLSSDAARAKVELLADVAAGLDTRVAEDPALLEGRRLADRAVERGWFGSGEARDAGQRS